MDACLNDLFKLSKADISTASESLGRAFRNYPLLKYAFAENSLREKMAFQFAWLALYYCLKYGEIYATSPNMEGVAAWLPSKYYPMTLWRLIRAVPFRVLAEFGKEGAAKLQKPGAYLDEMHKRLTPFKHWFLLTLGVSPEFQGKGYASKLLKPMLVKIDNQCLPCYTETMDEKNIRIYERFGFEILEQSDVPETGLTTWAMLRGAC